MNKIVYNGEMETVAFKDCIAATIENILSTDDKAAYLDCDLMASVGTGGLTQKFPERAINCGIQEANMIGVACGMSAEGMKPYCHTFGAFAGRRCYDQVFMSGAYAKNSIRILGSDPGVQALYNGGTHMPFEDVALYRTIPNTTIIEPCDATQLEWALRATKDIDGVVYIRMSRKNQVAIYESSSKFEFGKGQVLAEGNDVTIVAVGMMVAEALKACEILKKEGINASVIDLVTIKPLDTELLTEYAKKTGCVVTCENSFVKGGVYGAVCECLSQTEPVPVEYIGVYEKFGEVGDLEYLKKTFGLNADEIVKKAKTAIGRK